tara:strand:- start:907 stop:1128 length:222 start_codon:yes stop_codon:yes gene_type:complete
MFMNELESKIIGMLKVFGDYGLHGIKISINEEDDIVIEDRSKFIIKTTKLTQDQFVSMSIKMLIQLVRSMKNG